MIKEIQQLLMVLFGFLTSVYFFYLFLINFRSLFFMFFQNIFDFFFLWIFKMYILSFFYAFLHFAVTFFYDFFVYCFGSFFSRQESIQGEIFLMKKSLIFESLKSYDFERETSFFIPNSLSRKHDYGTIVFYKVHVTIYQRSIYQRWYDDISTRVPTRIYCFTSYYVYMLRIYNLRILTINSFLDVFRVSF